MLLCVGNHTVQALLLGRRTSPRKAQLLLGKFAAVLGPSVVGLVAATTGNPRLSILALIAFFIIGIVLLARVPAPPSP